MIYITAILIVLGSFGIGAWLVVNDHPWFALLIILCGASFSTKQKIKIKRNDHETNN